MKLCLLCFLLSVSSFLGSPPFFTGPFQWPGCCVPHYWLCSYVLSYILSAALLPSENITIRVFWFPWKLQNPLSAHKVRCRVIPVWDLHIWTLALTFLHLHSPPSAWPGQLKLLLAPGHTVAMCSPLCSGVADGLEVASKIQDMSVPWSWPSNTRPW